MKKRSKLAVLLALTALLQSPLSAAVITWSGTTSGDFNTASNWVDGVVPVNGDELRLVATTGTRTIVNTPNITLNGITATGSAYNVGGTTAGPINLAGNIDFTAGGSSTLVFTAPIVLQQNAIVRIDRTTTSTPSVSFLNTVSGNFGITVNGQGTSGSGAGELRIEAGMTYTGNTTVDAGSINFRLGAPSFAGNLVLNGTSSLFLNNVNGSIGALNGVAGTSVTKGGSGSRSLTVGTNNGSGVYGGSVNLAGGSASSIIKTGTGTQAFNGNVTSTGAGIVNGGTLLVNGTWGSGVNVNAGGTLGGSGVINGAVNVVGGTIAAGTSPGTLTINNALSLNDLSSLSFELNGIDTTIGGGVNDLITGVTNLSLDGVLNITETSIGSFLNAVSGSTWRLINYSGTLTDNGLTLGTTPTLASGGSLAIDTSVAGQVNLVYTAVAIPEPSSVGLIGLAFGALCFTRRRRA